jgi:PII-like signaling protein
LNPRYKFIVLGQTVKILGFGGKQAIEEKMIFKLSSDG